MFAHALALLIEKSISYTTTTTTTTTQQEGKEIRLNVRKKGAEEI
jgi:hypothetical protein